MKILISGGHITPALAVIDELPAPIKAKLIFVGRKHNHIFDNELSFEYKEIEKRQIKFIDLHAGRLSAYLSIYTLINLLLLPIGFLQALWIVLRYQPEKILSYGGYLGFPITLAAAIFRIPIFIHEQTIKPGNANRLGAFFAEKIFVSFPETLAYFKQEKTIVTGNPIRRSLFAESKKMLFLKDIKKNIIYVTGGSLGSKKINSLIEQILPDLLQDYYVIHQCGSYDDNVDYCRMKQINHPNYFIQPHFDDQELSQIYSRVDLVISRAGANTIFELIAMEKAAILIPLKIAAYGEQQHHAEMMKKNGVANIFQETGESHDLYIIICQMMNDRHSYRKNFFKLKSLYRTNSAKEICRILLQ